MPEDNENKEFIGTSQFSFQREHNLISNFSDFFFFVCVKYGKSEKAGVHEKTLEA